MVIKITLLCVSLALILMSFYSMHLVIQLRTCKKVMKQCVNELYKRHDRLVIKLLKDELRKHRKGYSK